MPFFDSDGVRIYYQDTGASGSGDVVALVHGFGSSARHNWGDTGWIDLLARRHRVLAPDVRGHGQSDKPHRRDAYGYRMMGADVIRLLDHLRIERAMLMGYSMGGSIAIDLMLWKPERFRAVVLGGIAYDDGLENPADRAAIAEAYRAADPSQITGAVARAYRRFAEAQGNDLAALAALMDGERAPIPPARFTAVRLPVLIVVGTRDDAIGDPRPLAEMIPGARLVMLEGRHHLDAPMDERYKQSVMEFFAAAPP